MMIYISCAKTMTARSRQQVPYTTVPYFEKEAHENAMHMAQFSTEELTRLLRINNKLAAENVLRYHDFLSPDTLRFRHCWLIQGLYSNASIQKISQKKTGSMRSSICLSLLFSMDYCDHWI